jgi:NAD(P)-dependent dehydrogenase (short-subunit alcohol dehydrogenase family)
MGKLTVLITGASSGFGELTARLLAETGYHVFATMRGVSGRKEDKAKELRAWADDNGYSLDVIELDVTDQPSVDAAVTTAIDTTGHVDVVVNNAGIGAGGVTETFTAEQHQQLFDVNYFGVIRVNRAVLPHMRELDSGLLIHVSSITGRLLFPFLGPYCPSKFALEAYAESLHHEFEQIGVDSVIVEPGAYGTDHQQSLMLPSDQARIESYGGLANVPERMSEDITEILSGDDAPDPSAVAEAILRLIETPANERPLRTVVDQISGALVEELNAAAGEKQQRLLEMFES